MRKSRGKIYYVDKLPLGSFSEIYGRHKHGELIQIPKYCTCCMKETHKSEIVTAKCTEYGPAECELAVTKFAEYLVENYNAIIINSSEGYNKGTHRSIIVSTDEDLSKFVGSVLWVCKSPYRPGLKRKNWFIDFKIKGEAEKVIFNPDLVVFSTFHSGGNGGQNVNKVETGVRAVYLPTGDVTVCTDERSQHANKKKALIRLEALVKNRNVEEQIESANDMRKSHVNLERGNAVAKFEGEKFKRVY